MFSMPIKISLKRLHYDLAFKENVFYFFYVQIRVLCEKSLCAKQALVLLISSMFS